MRKAQSCIARGISAAAAPRSGGGGSRFFGMKGDASSSSSTSTSTSTSTSSSSTSSSLSAALRPLYAVIHPDAVHGHAEAEKANAVAFNELREWSRDVESSGGAAATTTGRRARRLSFFVREGETSSVAAVSAALPSPAAARRSRDPTALLRPLLVAAGLAEKGQGDEEDRYFEEQEEEAEREELRRRSGARASSPSSALRDVDDALLASLRDPRAFFAAASQASRARRASASARAGSAVVLDASRRRAALRIVFGVSVRYGRGFSPSSTSCSSSFDGDDYPAPEEVARQVRRLAGAVEGFLGGSDEEGGPLLRGSTILLVREKKRKKKTPKSKPETGSPRSSGLDLPSGSILLDVSEDTLRWLEALGEASDPAMGAAALREAAGRRAEAEELAAAALGVESVSLLLKKEEEIDQLTLARYDALVQELASAAAPGSGEPPEQRRHAGVSVVVVAAAAPSSSSSASPPLPSVAVSLAHSPSALSVFSEVESLAPAATAKLLEIKKAEQATGKLLRAAALKLGVSKELKRANSEGEGEGEGGRELLPLAEAAAVAARILRAPDSSKIAGAAKGFQVVYLGKRNAVSRDGEKVTLGVDFEV